MNEPPNNEQIAEMFARRDRFRMAMEERRTPTERMAQFFARQKWNYRSMTPEGYRGFLERNYKMRAISAGKAIWSMTPTAFSQRSLAMKFLS